MRKRPIIMCFLLAVLMIFSASASVIADDTAYSVTEISKYGNATLDVTCEAFLALGYKYGDVVSVSVNGSTPINAPFVSNYSDVDSGTLAVLARASDTNVSVAINMGNFAGTYSAAVGDKITIALVTAGGYYDEYLIHQLSRTNERADYAELSDAQFANFRNVALGNIPKGVLYRASSPVNNEIGRAKYADAAAKDAEIGFVMNLADSEEVLQGYFAAEGFESEYYKSLYEAGKVTTLNMGVDFAAADFSAKLAEGVRAINASSGAILVHCNEGKDRAGFVCAIFEALAGGKLDSIIADYMLSYENYYGVEKGSDQYNAIVNSNIIKFLCAAFGAADSQALSAMDLSAAARTYLSGIGLTDSEITALNTRLSTALPKTASDNPPTGDCSAILLAAMTLCAFALLTKKFAAAK